MIPTRSLPTVHRLSRDGQTMRGNVVYLWSGPNEARMRRPHESPVPRATPARIIQLPDLTATPHDEVRGMARRAFRAERAAMIRERTNSLCKPAE